MRRGLVVYYSGVILAFYSNIFIFVMPRKVAFRRQHSPQRYIEVCVSIGAHTPREISQSFQRRITEFVHSRLQVRFQPADKAAQLSKVCQASDIAALYDLCLVAIANL